MSKAKMPNTGSKERRAFMMPDITASNSDTKNIVEGHAAVFDQAVDIGGMWDEVIERGAFDKCDFTDVLFSVNHGFMDKIPLARSRNNNANSTMQLQVDDTGLFIRAALDTDNNTEAKALYSAVERGDMSGMSFVFVVRGQKWERLDTDKPLRRITDIAQVLEVSAVSIPAYDGTDINARSADELDSLRQALDSARDEYNHADLRKKLILKTYL